MKTFYGYMRVSTKEQNEGRQKIKLADVGIREENMFLDRQSGKDFERKEWCKVMNLLGSNTVLFVTSLDRLGRNYKEIMRQWKTITQEKCADIVVLDMLLLDTRNQRDLIGILINDLVLTIFKLCRRNRAHVHQDKAGGRNRCGTAERRLLRSSRAESSRKFSCGKSALRSKGNHTLTGSPKLWDEAYYLLGKSPCAEMKLFAPQLNYKSEIWRENAPLPIAEIPESNK